MKNFNVVYEILSNELNKNKTILTEHIYFDSLFENLINYCCHFLITSDELLKINFDDLNTLIDSKWTGKKYLNKNKKLYILFYDMLDKINWITKEELKEIDKRIKLDNGIFCSDFKNDKNTAIIILNELPIYEYKRVIMHELIHFFQWNTGKSIHQFQRSEINSNELNEIKNILKIDNVQSVISYVQNANEVETFCNNIFNYLKDFCKEHNLTFNKFIISAICDCFQNKDQISFQKYYENVLQNFKKYFNLNINISDFNYFNYMLLLGFFKHGFNSFKNHLFGYFQKEQKN